MADVIRIKGGSGDVPTLQDREFAVKKDTKELYVGINGENIRLCGASDMEDIKKYIDGLIAEINARLDG